MSDHIRYAINRIHREINPEVLNLAHTSDYTNDYDYRNLDSRIEQDTINNILLMDLNLVSGSVETLDISTVGREAFNKGTRIVIPASLRQGRNITAVFNLLQGGQGEGDYTASVLGTPMFNGTDKVYLPAPNVITTPLYLTTRYLGLRCRLEHDSHLRNLPASTQLLFGNLAVLAEKGFIYNRLGVSTSYTYNTGGASSGRMRDIIDGYSDAFEMYNEAGLRKWRKVSMMSNKQQHYNLTGLRLSR